MAKVPSNLDKSCVNCWLNFHLMICSIFNGNKLSCLSVPHHFNSQNFAETFTNMQIQWAFPAKNTSGSLKFNTKKFTTKRTFKPACREMCLDFDVVKVFRVVSFKKPPTELIRHFHRHKFLYLKLILSPHIRKKKVLKEMLRKKFTTHLLLIDGHQNCINIPNKDTLSLEHVFLQGQPIGYLKDRFVETCRERSSSSKSFCPRFGGKRARDVGFGWICWVN